MVSSMKELSQSPEELMSTARLCSVFTLSCFAYPCRMGEEPVYFVCGRGRRHSSLPLHHWGVIKAICLRSLYWLGGITAVKTNSCGSPALGIAKMADPLVTSGKFPPSRLPDPSALMAIVPRVG